MPELTQFDHYLTDNGPAALISRECLMPVEGLDGVFFPATFAAGDGFPGGYNINTFGDEKDGRNVCLVDSVGSQANRIEPLFMRDRYRHLVPQVVITAGERQINLLEVGHRAGDALVRCSALGAEIDSAFAASIRGDATPLARIAPTSLVFGVWNSRGTKGNQDKRPRLVASTVRAFNVRRLTRSAVYTPPLDYTVFDVFGEEDKATAERNNKSPLAQRGFVHNPASGQHGGVIADGGIRRDASLGLAAFRHLHGMDEDKSLLLRRYILGLSLVAFTAPMDMYLRQGCMLVRNPDLPSEFVEVHRDGRRTPCSITHDAALDFATVAAKAFGVAQADRIFPFEKDRARQDVARDGEKTARKRGKKADTQAAAPETDA